jgi:outer membrane immunogenic protein
MKRLLLSATALVALASVAQAADLPSRAPPPVFTPIPVFTWTGFYVGVNAGWGWRNDDTQSVIIAPGTVVGAPNLAGTLVFPSNDDGAFTGGGQIGYNYQIGSFVIGAEADIQWNESGDDQVVGFVPAGGFLAGDFVPGVFQSTSPDWFGTLRARAGFAIDRVLIYATGGLAYTEDNTGWVLGGGVEWALPVNWFGSSAVTFGVEGLWLNIDQDSFSGPVGSFTPIATPLQPVPVFVPAVGSNESEFGIIRAKLNFKF